MKKRGLSEEDLDRLHNGKRPKTFSEELRIGDDEETAVEVKRPMTFSEELGMTTLEPQNQNREFTFSEELALNDDPFSTFITQGCQVDASDKGVLIGYLDWKVLVNGNDVNVSQGDDDLVLFVEELKEKGMLGTDIVQSLIFR